MEAGIQVTESTHENRKAHFPTADDWHGDHDIDEDVEKHRAKVQLDLNSICASSRGLRFDQAIEVNE